MNILMSAQPRNSQNPNQQKQQLGQQDSTQQQLEEPSISCLTFTNARNQQYNSNKYPHHATHPDENPLHSVSVST